MSVCRILNSKGRALAPVRRISPPHTPQTNLLQLLQEQLSELPRVAAEAISGLALRFREVAEDDMDRRAVIELFFGWLIFFDLFAKVSFPRVSSHCACPFSFASRKVRAIKLGISISPQQGHRTVKSDTLATATALMASATAAPPLLLLLPLPPPLLPGVACLPPHTFASASSASSKLVGVSKAPGLTAKHFEIILPLTPRAPSGLVPSTSGGGAEAASAGDADDDEAAAALFYFPPPPPPPLLFDCFTALLSAVRSALRLSRALSSPLVALCLQ